MVIISIYPIRMTDSSIKLLRNRPGFEKPLRKAQHIVLPCPTDCSPIDDFLLFNLRLQGVKRRVRGLALSRCDAMHTR